MSVGRTILREGEVGYFSGERGLKLRENAEGGSKGLRGRSLFSEDIRGKLKDLQLLRGDVRRG